MTNECRTVCQGLSETLCQDTKASHFFGKKQKVLLLAPASETSAIAFTLNMVYSYVVSLCTRHIRKDVNPLVNLTL
jgi:hypothetical protein